jgi:2-iminobutanoate/2-iminopropanoate deaminase
VTRGGKIVWVSGHEAIDELNGKLAGDFLGQARATFKNIDATLKSSGGSLENLVTMTVFIKDPRYGNDLLKLRHEMFPNGKFPASTLITISGFARPDMLIEIQGVAVIGN